MSVEIIIGDCREAMAAMQPESVDSCVCDPPYHLTSIHKRFAKCGGATRQVPKKSHQYQRLSRGFMGQTWDGGDVAFDPATWEAVYRVLKPGAHLIAFSGTRTYHRMVCAIEDAGFEIRDQLAWAFGSGFPKSHDVSKGIDKMLGAEREVLAEGKPVKRMIPGADQNKVGWIKDNGREFVPTVTAAGSPEAAEWQGWGTALKPAWEPICLARKPLIGTVAANVLQHGTGAINIDGCRVEGTMDGVWGSSNSTVNPDRKFNASPDGDEYRSAPHTLGRWPANIIHDGSEEVLAGFPDAPGQQGDLTGHSRDRISKGIYGDFPAARDSLARGDTGSAARFFYSAKATAAERGEGNTHPTVKPVDLMRWLCRLVTPKGGTVLDPFAGSGSTLIAADAEQFNAIGCELSPEYAAIAERRVRAAAGLFADVRAA